jgi:hypothetical protein
MSGEAAMQRRRGDPLNQPGGHWERAADTQLRGVWRSWLHRVGKSHEFFTKLI